ncbi:hypothetical protein [Legionella pneumophila]|nr:hypothetical protein [Legionella pneumophila]HAT6916195.1 hypothetical protein [Legionella pneumophila]HAT6918775.1 hypothetical protein [Legionella pneumophila]HAT6971411.1 hypothetical protein [Legionella pneumophila]HAU3861046.1 hypothetical protein [Legionella pneumophila]HAU4217241.1 hypothetical protein [Legionella pneumophila]
MRRKIAVRAKQVMALYSQVCLGNSFQINVAKITTPVELIDLAWVLAICSLRTLNFKSTALIALKINTYNKLMTMVNELPLENKLEQKIVNEVQLHDKNSLQEIRSYILPPGAVIKFLSLESGFIGLCINLASENTCKALKDVKEKTLNSSVTSKQLPETNIQTKIYDGRPSDKKSSKCEFIVRELEDIAESFDMKINRETLWSQLKIKCNGESRFQIEGKKYIVEKATENKWDREGLKYHMDDVIEWHKQNNPQFYS